MSIHLDSTPHNGSLHREDVRLHTTCALQLPQCALRIETPFLQAFAAISPVLSLACSRLVNPAGFASMRNAENRSSLNLRFIPHHPK